MFEIGICETIAHVNLSQILSNQMRFPYKCLSLSSQPKTLRKTYFLEKTENSEKITSKLTIVIIKSKLTVQYIHNGLKKSNSIPFS